MATGIDLSSRLGWFVDAVAPAPGERILEVGCGTGQAACAMALTVRPGLVTAIDRSASAIASAKANAAKTGAEIVLVQSTLADFGGGLFDKVAACRLNAFWTGSATAELAAVRRLLDPGGALCVCLQPPSASKLDSEVAAVRSNLAAGGFDVADVLRDDAVPAACVIARPRQGAS